MLAAVSHRLRDPVTWTNVSQLVKTVIAAVAAWILAVHVFHIAQPFLAPWAALLTVHATVFGTLRRGGQQAAASVLGVLFAFGAGQVFGVGVLSLGAAILLGLIAGATPGLRAETTTAAATALVVLTTGYSNNGGMLTARLLDTGIGIAVGLLVNFVVWPPLRDRSAAHQINVISERLGGLLGDIAADLGREDAPTARDGDRGPEGWIDRTDELDGDVDQAWRFLAQARESGRLNPRPAAPGRMRAAEDFRPLLNQLAQAVAETRSMARTIGLAHTPPERWEPSFRDPWLALVNRAGAAVAAADVDAVRGVRADLETFADELAIDQLPAGFWPVSGALLVSLRNILEALDVVAEARPLGPPSPALAARRAVSPDGGSAAARQPG
ncbi:MAG: aromatic acid exporter family protein [Solirubrobacteraceae bacterium]